MTLLENPNDVFQFFISPQSNAALTEQLRRLQLLIPEALKRREFPLLAFRLSNLAKLAHILYNKEVVHLLDECKELTRKELTRQLEAGSHYLEVLMKEGYVATEADLDLFMQALNLLTGSDDCLGEILHVQGADNY